MELNLAAAEKPRDLLDQPHCTARIEVQATRSACSTDKPTDAIPATSLSPSYCSSGRPSLGTYDDVRRTSGQVHRSHDVAMALYQRSFPDQHFLKDERTGCMDAEYAKMVAGKRFDLATSPALMTRRLQARRLCAAYNADTTPPYLPLDHTRETQDDQAHPVQEAQAARRLALTHIIGHVGRDCAVDPPLTVTFGTNIRFRDHVHADANLQLYDHSIIDVGNWVCIGPDVKLVTQKPSEDGTRRKQPGHGSTAQPIVIGNECSLGAGVTVLGGVHVGAGSVILPGSVVAADVPVGSVMCGVPATWVKWAEVSYECDWTEGDT